MNRLFASIARCAVLAAAMLASHQTFAQGINIDIEGSVTGGSPGTGIPATTFGGAANQPGQWNRVFNAPNPTNLNGLDGLASGVTLTRSTTLTHTGFDNLNTSGDFQFLFDDYQTLVGGANHTVSFAGLDAGWYEVYTYVINPSASTSKTRVTIADGMPIEQQIGGGVMPPNAFILNRTHTLHRVLVSGAGTLSMSLTLAGGNAAALGGLQLKPVDPCPIVDITDPVNFDCVCESVNVKGDVNVAQPGSLAFWYLEYRGLSDLNWTLINFGFNSGNNLMLGTFNTAGLPQDYYFIRLTGVGGDGCDHEDTHIVFVDKQFDILDMTHPIPGQAYGGTVCVGGVLNDHCLRYYTAQWAPLPAGAPFTDVNPLMPFYFTQIYNAVTFATWDTVAQMIPDGNYRVRVDAVDNCGHEAFDESDIIVDNTPPEADILSPENCAFIQCGSMVNVKGTACDVNLSNWVLQVTGGTYVGWVTIASGNTCVIEDLLGVWDTTGLPNCAYSLRLLVNDSAILNCNGAIVHQTEDVVSVNIGLAGDVNGDGVVSFQDITDVLTFWGFTCP